MYTYIRTCIHGVRHKSIICKFNSGRVVTTFKINYNFSNQNSNKLIHRVQIFKQIQRTSLVFNNSKMHATCQPSNVLRFQQKKNNNFKHFEYGH